MEASLGYTGSFRPARTAYFKSPKREEGREGVKKKPREEDFIGLVMFPMMEGRQGRTSKRKTNKQTLLT